jgi:prepilin peptidase CpaA
VPVAIFAAAVVIYAAVAAQDLQQRRVSNLLCAGIAVLGLARWALLMQITPAAWAVALAVVLFGIGFLFFVRGWLGGGDVKLITATVLLIGADSTPAFLFLMSVIGSALALIIIIYIRLGRLFGTTVPESEDTVEDTMIATADRFKVPYGVAVAIAASVVVFLQIQRA